ncbi:hypothetical protein SAMN06265222_11686 [Neorhodopirellula lusitana]|uniref:Uncharacterized protein n=1 Tax=Neorhodopirellula lusitana TaxID=445327 RepID=A0ABY1QJJ0_9BACT|nr:hypothetical protein SAMN06265222_11686 [Neorhodopirellula lusitana]
MPMSIRHPRRTDAWISNERLLNVVFRLILSNEWNPIDRCNDITVGSERLSNNSNRNRNHITALANTADNTRDLVAQTRNPFTNRQRGFVAKS